MELSLDYKKTVDQNASIYFEKAKKAKSKAEGAKEAIVKMEKKLLEIEKKEAQVKEKIAASEKPERKKHWFEKFRWFRSSEGYLVVGGRDATSNEVLIKKHVDKDDIVFHTDMAGSPFFVVKKDSVEGKDIGDTTLEETAIATASFSRAWKNGLTTLDVFHVKPEQVSKTANSGEYMAKGSFMIRGKTTYHHPTIKLAIGVVSDGQEKGIIMSGSLESVKANCKDTIEIKQGKMKPSDAAKKIKAKLKTGELDEIIRLLPAGGVELK